MVSRIGKFIREFIFILSIIIIIIGFFLISMGVLWFGLTDILIGNETLRIIYDLGEWNAYILVIGLIILGFGIYYLYNYLKNRKFALDELKTDKRSEFIKKHNELKNTIKHLPSKYQKMLKDKENQLNIK